jgi:hypothetical protein
MMGGMGDPMMDPMAGDMMMGAPMMDPMMGAPMPMGGADGGDPASVAIASIEVAIENVSMLPDDALALALEAFTMEAENRMEAQMGGAGGMGDMGGMPMDPMMGGMGGMPMDPMMGAPADPMMGAPMPAPAGGINTLPMV